MTPTPDIPAFICGTIEAGSAALFGDSKPYLTINVPQEMVIGRKLGDEVWLTFANPAVERPEAVGEGDWQKEAEEWKRKFLIQRDEANSNTWIWEPEGDNHLETLTCPIIIDAETLREIIRKHQDQPVDHEDIKREFAENLSRIPVKDQPGAPVAPGPWRIGVVNEYGDIPICSDRYGHIAYLSCRSGEDRATTLASAQAICDAVNAKQPGAEPNFTA